MTHVTLYDITRIVIDRKYEQGKPNELYLKIKINIKNYTYHRITEQATSKQQKNTQLTANSKLKAVDYRQKTLFVKLSAHLGQIFSPNHIFK